MCDLEISACFEDFITYRGSGVTPTSGLYVNDLYGMYFTKADAIANTDYATGIEFIEYILNRSIILVTSELKRYIMPYFKINSVVGHYLGGKFDDGLEYHSADTVDRGLRIDIKESTLGEVVINRVRVLFNDDGVQNITVTDGVTTSTYAVTLAAGVEQDVEINYHCVRKRVYITMDNALHPAKGDVRMDYYPDYDILAVRGYNGDLTSSHYGIRADVTITCSMDRVACLLKEFLGLPILYRFGIEMAREALETDRINYFTLTNRDGIKELLEGYQVDYGHEMEQLSRSIPKLMSKLDSFCVDCNQNRYTERVP